MRLQIAKSGMSDCVAPMFFYEMSPVGHMKMLIVEPGGRVRFVVSKFVF